MTRITAAQAKAAGVKIKRQPSDLEETLVGQMRMAGLPVAVREFRFSPLRMWRFDLAYPDRLLAIEIEGGTWVRGGHSRGTGFAKDTEKYNTAALEGWVVLRFDNHAVKDGSALAVIERALATFLPQR